MDSEVKEEPDSDHEQEFTWSYQEDPALIKQDSTITDDTVTSKPGKLFKCDTCSKTFKFLCDIKRHLICHSEETHYKCSFCGKEYKRKDTFNYHMNTHTKEKSYACEICGKVFWKSGNLKQHLAVHIPTHLDDNQGVDNTSENLLQCKVCGRGCATKVSLNLHLLSHSRQTYTCNICGREFSRRDNYNVHMNTHTKKRSYDCEMCGKIFWRVSSLKSHLTVHSMESLFECETCQEKFTKKSDLNVHSKIHTSDRLFKCSQCDETFFSVHYLRRHKVVHSRNESLDLNPYVSEKVVKMESTESYVCEVCKKMFRAKRYLARHLKTHNTGREYECKTCGKAFKTPQHLKRHFLTQHQFKTLNESVKDDESDLEGFDVVDTTVEEPNQKMTSVRRLRGSKPQSVIYCPNCGQHCDNYNDYDKHILDNPSHQSFDCFQCKKHFEFFPDLKQHVEKAHLKEFLASAPSVGYFCHFCGSKEMSIKKLDAHIHKDHVKWVLECTMCSRFYKNPRALYNHFEIVHAVINNIDFLCNQCDLHFYDPEIYTFHMNRYHKVELKSLTYQCVLCTSKLKEMNEFIQHVHKHGKYTGSSEEMKDGRPAFVVWSRQCFICSKVAQDRVELKDHLMNVHFSSKICPLCNIKVKGTVELHLREIHSLSLDINLLRGEQSQRYFPFVFSVNKNKHLANSAPEKICEVCYGVLPKKAFAQHMAMHKNQGIDQLKSQNPVVDTVPNQNQLTFCKTCRLRVVTTFTKWHNNIHKKHENKPAKRLRSPARPRNRSRPRRSRSRDRARFRAEMKCTECDRSYDTVENLVNHVKAQHFTAPLQPSSYHPYMPGMVPMEFQAVGAPEPFGFQNPIPDVNVLSLGGNFSQRGSSDRTGSARSRRDFRNRPKF